jgi:hypothetical protein
LHRERGGTTIDTFLHHLHDALDRPLDRDVLVYLDNLRYSTPSEPCGRWCGRTEPTAPYIRRCTAGWSGQDARDAFSGTGQYVRTSGMRAQPAQ